MYEKRIDDEIEKFLKRFIVLPKQSHWELTTLWILHTHLMQHWNITPRLMFLCPTTRGGKSTAVRMVRALCPNPTPVAAPTPASLYRLCSDKDKLPTITIDECQRVLNPNNPAYDAVSTVIIEGFERDNPIRRWDTETRGMLEFDAFAPMILAGRKKLVDDIENRCITIPIRKAVPLERERKKHKNQALELRQEIDKWVKCIDVSVSEGLENLVLPEWLDGRDADMFEPLLVISEILNKRENVEKAIQEYLRGVAAISEECNELVILEDMYELFEFFQDKQGRLSSAKAIEELNKMSDRPWKEFNNGRSLTPHKLSDLLKHWDIAPSKNSERYMGREPVKVYYRDQFEPNWKSNGIPQSELNPSSRYDTPIQTDQSDTTVTPIQAYTKNGDPVDTSNWKLHSSIHVNGEQQNIYEILKG